MTIRIKMLPNVKEVKGGPSGISRVVEAYYRYLPDFDVELVEENARRYDLKASHAGITAGDTDIAILHGIYFSGDYSANDWEWRVNARIVEAIRHAKEITVPSAWVAETFERDIRKSPHVIPHGIEWQDWQHKEQNRGYVLWNKNRRGDVCSNDILDPLVRSFPDIRFVSTLTTPMTDRLNKAVWPSNFKILVDGNKTPHAKMKLVVQRAGVYLSTTKETFGIGILEAMASGIPVLGWNYGGNVQLVEHGVNGYLAEPGNFDDLCDGLVYCYKHRATLGANAIEMAKKWTWADACKKLVKVFELAMVEEPATVSVVIPVYNKPVEQVKRAVESVKSQTIKPDKIILVDDGSRNELSEQYRQISGIEYIRQHNQGVAEARNNGIARTTSKYICCLDSDDGIEPTFLETCIKPLENDHSLGIAYTKLMAHRPDQEPVVSQWPGEFDYDRQLERHNQVPTACVFRRDAWERVGGYRSRYCPNGAGSEDAAFWTAIGSIGYNAKLVTDKPLFNYSLGTGLASGNKDYKEANWLSFYPWATDKLHPLASIATPAHGPSHPVRQYDQPVISVIIPVGPGHEKEVINALDSLEAQHFRKWEAVICNDTGKPLELIAFPYARIIDTGHNGAGHARNRGVEAARGNLIFYLDADDMLYGPDAFDKMLDAWNDTQDIVYTDYLGRAQWDKAEAQKTFKQDLLDYNDKQQIALFRSRAAEFDCAKAQRQPEYSNDTNMPYYHWCLISVLLPRAWHIEVGGFDESMKTWEDVDYIWRLAKAGKCFYHLKEPAIIYNYHKGQRRVASQVQSGNEKSLQSFKSLVQYIREKYERIQNVGCNCGKRKPPATVTAEAASAMSDNDFVMIEFHFPGDNTRTTYGSMLSSPTQQKGPDGKILQYGFRRKGDRFLVHVKDQQNRPDMFKIVPDEIKVPVPKRKPLPEPAPIVEIEPGPAQSPPPEQTYDPTIDAFDFAQIDGVSTKAAKAMAHLTADEALELGVEGLVQIKGVGKVTAQKVIDYLL